MEIVRAKKHILLPILALILLVIGIFAWLNKDNLSSAADARNFNASNIMSDAVMTNKSSMSEAQIQAFLRSKNACNDTNVGKAAQYPNMRYNIKNGKFVCLAEESFNGESAARIIWQAGQDYNINPQVLIVLLEKEQGLITDTWPNSNVQYRSATGYGCPDTAACDTKYYGFKNQVRNAANFFRAYQTGNHGWYKTVWPGDKYTGAWTPFNYNLQLHPNIGCGTVSTHIANRATASLYSYTPYRPNQAALNAQTGTGDGCSSYGNRNFWMFFSNWFGDTQKSLFSDMDVSRKLVAKTNVSKIDPITGTDVPDQKISGGQVVKYSSKAYTVNNNNLCLRTESNTNTDERMCVPYNSLQEGPSFSTISNKKLLAIENTPKIDPIDSTPVAGQTLTKGQIADYTSSTTTRLNGKTCLRTKSNTDSGLLACIPREKLSEVPPFSSLNPSQYMVATNTVSKIDPYTELPVANQTIHKGMLIEYSSKINTLKSNEQCMRTVANTKTNSSMCITIKNLKTYVDPNFTNMDVARSLRTSKDTYKIDPTTGEKVESLPINLPIDFSQKTYHQGDLCLRTKTDTGLNKQTCVLYSNLTEM